MKFAFVRLHWLLPFISFCSPRTMEWIFCASRNVTRHEIRQVFWPLL